MIGARLCTCRLHILLHTGPSTFAKTTTDYFECTLTSKLVALTNLFIDHSHLRGLLSNFEGTGVMAMHFQQLWRKG